MRNLSNIIEKLIPPNDYLHRNGFSNHSIIDNLTEEERLHVEKVLISRLKTENDSLIVITLSYMKSVKALPILYEILKKNESHLYTIVLASSIYTIKNDYDIIDIAINNFLQLDNIYQKIQAFYFLNKFENNKTDDVIRLYINDKNPLLSENAKFSLTNRDVYLS